MIEPLLDADIQEKIIISIAVFSILYGILNAILVLRIKVVQVEDGMNDENQAIRNEIPDSKLRMMEDIAKLISDGSDVFLKTEFITIGIFTVIFAIIIAMVVEKDPGTFYVTGAYLLGSITSIASGYIGMWISVRANVRTTMRCNSHLHLGFITAFRGGAVLGFCLVGLGLLNLVLLIMVYKAHFLDLSGTSKNRGYEEMFEAIAGYGLGGSCVALFSRVGGGIYTKAADVGADLVGKVVQDLDEDSIQNPGTIADNVGDNVGDIAGMGADLFGSLAESTCACLVISGSSPDLIRQSGYYYPLLVTAVGIVVCAFCSLISIHCIRASTSERVYLSLNLQLLLTTVLMTPGLYFTSHYFLPKEFIIKTSTDVHVTNMEAFWCCVLGLWSGYIIGYMTNYYTSGSYAPVKKLAT